MKKILLTIICGFILIPSYAYACTCVPSNAGSMEESTKSAKYVVLGNVEEVSEIKKGGDYTFKLNIKKSWKESLNKTITLSSNKNNFSCGIGIVKKGDEYLFYLNEKNNLEFYKASTCERNLKVKEAKEDIEYLNSNFVK